MRVLQLLMLLSVMGAAAPAQEIKLPGWADARKREAVVWPKALRGLVQDEAEKPVANAKVTVVLQVQLYPPGGYIVEKDVYRREVTTDESGKWTLPTKDFPRIVHRPHSIVVMASAPNLVPWKTWVWHGMSDKKAFSGPLNVTLPEGYQVAGVCVDEDGAPVKGARFRVVHGNMGGGGRWATRDYECNDRGEFSLLVPKAGKKAFWIYGETLAPTYKPAPEEEKRDVRYEVKSGARAIGFVRDEAGKPAANVVVLGTSSFRGSMRGYSRPFTVFARTDNKGSFRLPPLEGEYMFMLTSAGKLVDGSFYESPEPAPTMVPVKRTLESGQEGFILRPSKSAIVSGTARWPDKSPAPGITISAFTKPGGKGRSVRLGESITDKDGRYSIRVPVPLQYFKVSASYSAYFKGKRVVPHAKSDTTVFTTSIAEKRSATAKPFKSDAKVDFDFVEEEQTDK